MPAKKKTTTKTKTKAQKIKSLKRQKNSLYKNVNLAKLGAGKKKKKNGKSNRPTDADFKRSARTAKKKPAKKRSVKR